LVATGSGGLAGVVLTLLGAGVSDGNTGALGVATAGVLVTVGSGGLAGWLAAGGTGVTGTAAGPLLTTAGGSGAGVGAFSTTLGAAGSSTDGVPGKVSSVSTRGRPCAGGQTRCLLGDAIAGAGTGDAAGGTFTDAAGGTFTGSARFTVTSGWTLIGAGGTATAFG
jgi:hypothetical protein